MSVDATYARSFVVAGLNFTISTTIESQLAIPWSVELAAAKSGSLSTRTDANTGTLTLESGHGVTTGARLDVYWDGGRRYGVTVGTVSGTAVPIDLGAGDDLPAAGTAVTAQVPDEEAVVVTGNNVTTIAAACAQGGTVVFADASDATLAVIELDATTAPSYVWTSADGGTNPLAGDAVAKVFLSQPSTAAAVDMNGCVQYN